MKVIVTKQHIKAARLSDGRLNPIEVALNDMDCFQEISLKSKEDSENFLLELDGMKIELPEKVKKNLNNYLETGEMKAFNFDLHMEDELMGEDGLLLDSFEDSLHLDMDFY